MAQYQPKTNKQQEAQSQKVLNPVPVDWETLRTLGCAPIFGLFSIGISLVFLVF